MKDLPKWLRVTTDAHRKEIEELVKDHSDAVVHFGGEMYRHGLIDATFYCIACTAVVYGVHKVGVYLKNKKQDHHED